MLLQVTLPTQTEDDLLGSQLLQRTLHLLLNVRPPVILLLARCLRS